MQHATSELLEQSEISADLYAKLGTCQDIVSINVIIEYELLPIHQVHQVHLLHILLGGINLFMKF